MSLEQQSSGGTQAALLDVLQRVDAQHLIKAVPECAQADAGFQCEYFESQWTVKIGLYVIPGTLHDLSSLGHTSGLRIRLGGQCQYHRADNLFLAVINGRGLRVHGYGDLALYDPIARTLRAAP